VNGFARPLLRGLGLVLIAACAVPASPPPAASPPAAGSAPTATAVPLAPLRLVVNWTAPSGTMAAIWVAHETGIYREEGLDVEVVNLQNSSRVIPSMLAGEIQISPLDPATTVLANLGGADFVLLVAMRNRLGYAVMSQPSIQQPQDLRGKSLGVTRVGASNHTAGMVALRTWGLVPDRDLALRQLGETSAIIAALEAGQIDAGVITQPVPRAVKANYQELIDLGKEGVEYASVAVGGLRGWVAANEEAVRRYVRAHVRADRRAQSDRELTVGAYRKYMQLDDAELLEDQFVSYLAMAPRPPYVSEPGVARVLEDLAADDPRVAAYQASDFVDSRYLRELEAAGLLR
jgi:NitT/TauT family transport system substrate-binding protein